MHPGSGGRRRRTNRKGSKSSCLLGRIGLVLLKERKARADRTCGVLHARAEDGAVAAANSGFAEAVHRRTGEAVHDGRVVHDAVVHARDGSHHAGVVGAAMARGAKRRVEGVLLHEKRRILAAQADRAISTGEADEGLAFQNELDDAGAPVSSRRPCSSTKLRSCWRLHDGAPQGGVPRLGAGYGAAASLSASSFRAAPAVACCCSMACMAAARPPLLALQSIT